MSKGADLTVLHWNPTTLQGKMGQLDEALRKYQPHAVGLTESRTAAALPGYDRVGTAEFNGVWLYTSQTFGAKETTVYEEKGQFAILLTACI